MTITVMAPVTRVATTKAGRPLTVIVTETAIRIDLTDQLLTDYVTQLHDFEVPYERHHLTASECAYHRLDAQFPGRTINDCTNWGLR